MSDVAMKSEIDKLIKESGLLKHPKMLCSIVKVFKMRYPDIDDARVCKFANEVLK
ncbi:MAG: hypothetical protein AABY36_09475 [Campylobacterota bacterium]